MNHLSDEQAASTLIELTFFRCYWPSVFRYLKQLELRDFRSEAFGMFITLAINAKLAKRISFMLPAGSVADWVQLELSDAHETQNIDDVLLNRQNYKALKSSKN